MTFDSRKYTGAKDQVSLTSASRNVQQRDFEVKLAIFALSCEKTWEMRMRDCFWKN